ncbi:MAG: alkaline phosphatase family protein [Acidobacteriota bacterium]
MTLHRSFRFVISILVLLALVAVVITMRPPVSTAAKKMIILGIDGLDPRLLQEFVDQGHLPHFRKLITEGDFSALQTTMPPLSPVAWSTFITGTDPGAHGIFDFIHRNPVTIRPEFAMVRTLPSNWNISIGSWVIPLSGGKIELLRQGRAFWEILEEHGVPTTVFRMPVNFPPSSEGKSFSGMGTPDILGTPGTFSFYTDFPAQNAGDLSGGRVFEVEIEDNKVQAQLVGPENPFRREQTSGESYSHPEMTIDFEVFIDPQEPVAKFVIQDDEFILREGEWSDWIRVDFEALPYLVGVSAVGRFYLQELRPDFRLYVTPLQINPEDPVMPLSTPESWAGKLQDDLGYFYTQELPEDTKAFSGGIFSGQEFWQQSQFVFREQRQALGHLLNSFQEGLLFFYFSSVDQGSHMFWSYMDPQHPSSTVDKELHDPIRVLYQEMDEALGRVLQSVDKETTLIVMSDHGFAPFYWGMNLNSWLVEKGYVKLKDPTRRGDDPLFSNVDWSGTRAYAVGLNGLYVNLRGREENGIVSQGAEYQRLLDQLEADLLAAKDPRNGRSPVSLVLQTRRDFRGQNLEAAPDIIAGYNWGYRSSWESPLGEFPREVFVDNLDPWSGDHSMDYRLVPGVLITNLQISLEKPALYDLTVAVLDEYGVSKLPEMIGQDCLD